MISIARCAVVLGLALSFCWASLATAEEAPAVKLLRPDSFLGWEHAGEPQGWTIKDGVLTASKDASKLVSGWTLGDFELTLAVKVEEGGELKLVLESDEPQANAALVVGAKSVTLRSKLEGDFVESTADLTGDGYRGFIVRRTGDQLQAQLKDGSVTWEATVNVPKAARLLLAIEGNQAAIKDLLLREPVGEPIYNGQDLNGWWTPSENNMKAWHAENGEIVKRGKNGNYLRTEKEFGNFTFTMEYLISKGGNSGVGIRTPRSGWPSTEGMELQLLDQKGLNKHSTMAIYGNLAPVARADKSEVWNQVTIKAEGPMISAWINGELVQHFNTARHPELKHRFQQGWIGLQDHGGINRFRNLRVLEAPAGAGPQAWQEPLPREGAELVLNRLMNSEQLAEQDGVRTNAVRGTIAGKEKQVLAELTGPGALVGLTFANDAGRVAFYFDGEEKPRLECAVKDVANRLPKLEAHNHPVLTYVPYEKSLKVVVQESQPGDFWLETAALPADVRVKTFTSAGSTIPRGWDSPLIYRREQHGWSTVRTVDPYPKANRQNQTVEPGSTVQLVALEEAGVLQWLQFNSPKAMLESDDLWLEVRIGGEQMIFAPARALFASVRDGKNHENYVATSRSSNVVLRLAMPYQEGLTITAHNRGKKELKGLGALVSYQKLAPEAVPALRLRARYQSQAEGDPRQIQLAGSGKLVALVCDSRDAQEQAVESLTVDDESLAAWQQAPLDLVLGRRAEEQEFRRVLSGRVDGRAWRYFVLAPVVYEKSLDLKLGSEGLQSTLVLYYQ